MTKPIELNTLLLADQEGSLPAWQRHAMQCWTAKITDREHKFPCIPAVQGHGLNHLRYGFIRNAEDQGSAAELAELLNEFVSRSEEYGAYTSLIVFAEPGSSSGQREDGVSYYERLFWSLLSRTSELDTRPWPEHIPMDPSEHLWEYCFGGQSYFVFCGTPDHKLRQSRSFPYMVLAFTPRWVLERFNAAPRQAMKTKQMIRSRLEAYDSVPPHPDLKLYGAKDNYEWRQYFIRDSSESLPACPFKRMYQHP